MSRVILSRYDTGQERVVVGWDHPANGFFWQIFTLEPKDEVYPEDWEEVEAYGGYGWPGLTAAQLLNDPPEEVRLLLTQNVLDLLTEHRLDPNSGRIPPVDMTKGVQE